MLHQISVVHQIPIVVLKCWQTQRSRGELHIHKTVVPIAQQARKIPFHIQKKVEVEL